MNAHNNNLKTKTMNKIIVFLLFGMTILISKDSVAQDYRHQISDIGAEFQVYPTGVLPGLRIDWALNNRSTLNLRTGLNIIRHRDLGVHEDERGLGVGFSLGYRRYFTSITQPLSRWFLGLRSDIWFNAIDWKDHIGLTNEVKGTSNIVVVQPTLEGGYLFTLGTNKQFTLAPSIAFGFEINVANDGEEVGEGAILLLGISGGYRFR